MKIISSQVQQWLGNDLDPEEYGWTLDKEYVPSPGYDIFCPPSIMKLISCGCKKDCSTLSCGCKKLSLKCTAMCKCTEACVNAPEDIEISSQSDSDDIDEDDDDDDDDEE